MKEPLSPAQLTERLLSSETKADLLTLFHRNPGLVDSREGVARRIGRTPEEITDEVEDLVVLGILSQKPVGAFKVLHFNRLRDREIQALLEDHFKGLRK
jgi:hypothetical protein